MDHYHHIWLAWAKTLHRWGVAQLVHHLLSELGSMNLLFAQAIYLVEPFFPSHTSQSLYALGLLLEEEIYREQFLALLRETARGAV